MTKGITYEQASGTLWVVNGGFACPLGEGYAGRGIHLNNPASECEKSRGPLPQGDYRMRVVPHRRFARPAIQLVPESGTEMCSRSGFWVHGDNGKGDKTASHGCIVTDHATRVAIAGLIEAGFKTLKVRP